jgi:hypothetical protein
MGTGSTEHSSTEIWSNQYRKWVMLDPTFAMYAEKDGIPLNAYELRQEWFYGDGKALTFVVGKERKRYHKSDMPIFRARFAGFGDLNFDPSGLNVYAFIGYVPNTNLMDAGPDYGKMFITRDKLCEGTKWHERVAPPDPANDPYFPIGQAMLDIHARTDGKLLVNLRSMTPNFKMFMSRVDDGDWSAVGDTPSFVDWTPHAGKNRLQVKTVNQFGVEGPISTAEAQIR